MHAETWHLQGWEVTMRCSGFLVSYVWFCKADIPSLHAERCGVTEPQPFLSNGMLVVCHKAFLPVFPPKNLYYCLVSANCITSVNVSYFFWAVLLLRGGSSTPPQQKPAQMTRVFWCKAACFLRPVNEIHLGLLFSQS